MAKFLAQKHLGSLRPADEAGNDALGVKLLMASWYRSRSSARGI